MTPADLRERATKKALPSLLATSLAVTDFPYLLIASRLGIQSLPDLLCGTIFAPYSLARTIVSK